MVVVQNQDQRAINYQFGAATGLNQAFPFVLVLDTTLLGIVTLMKFIFLFFPVDFVEIRLAQASHTWLGNMNRKCEKKNCMYTHIYQNMNKLSCGVTLSFRRSEPVGKSWLICKQHPFQERKRSSRLRFFTIN